MDETKYENEKWVSVTLIRFEERMYETKKKHELQINEINEELKRIKSEAESDKCIVKFGAFMILIVCILLGIICYLISIRSR